MSRTAGDLIESINLVGCDVPDAPLYLTDIPLSLQIFSVAVFFFDIVEIFAIEM